MRPMPAEGYRIEADATDHWIVHAHDVLGAQYGVAARAREPRVPVPPSVRPVRARRRRRDRGQDDRGSCTRRRSACAGCTSTRCIRSRATSRSGSRAPAARTTRTASSTGSIKNRGNYLQWVALDDIIDPDALRGRGRRSRSELIDVRAHARRPRRPRHPAVRRSRTCSTRSTSSTTRPARCRSPTRSPARLPLVTQDLPFDVYDLSFGEFFNADPQKFIDAVNEVARQLAHARAAGRDARARPRRRDAARDVHGPGPASTTSSSSSPTRRSSPTSTRSCTTTCSRTRAARTSTTDFSEHRAVPASSGCAPARRPRTPRRPRTGSRSTTRCRMFVPLYVHSRLARSRRARAASGVRPARRAPAVLERAGSGATGCNDVDRAARELRAARRAAGRHRRCLRARPRPEAAALVDRLATAQHDALIDPAPRRLPRRPRRGDRCRPRARTSSRSRIASRSISSHDRERRQLRADRR